MEIEKEEKLNKIRGCEKLNWMLVNWTRGEEVCVCDSSKWMEINCVMKLRSFFYEDLITSEKCAGGDGLENSAI